MARQIDPADRLAKLDDVLAGAKTLLIVMQNSPDPDAVAAAAALREIANQRHGISCSLAHSGTVGRAENRALLSYLGLNMRPLHTVEPERFDRVAVVDAQPGAGNLGLDPTARVDIVIDHHPIRRESRSARFTDIRSRFGATSTVLFQYLRAAGLAIPSKLATAMVYGIRSDTQDLGRESTRFDVEAFLALYPNANPRALGRIVSAALPRAYFASLRTALDAAMVHGDRVVSFLGRVDNQDMIAETADLLLRVEGAAWSFCLGEVDGWIHGSLRSNEREHNVGALARKLAGRNGFGGGHHMLAAIQVPLPAEDLTARKLEWHATSLLRRFLHATGAPANGGEPLCKPAS